MKGIATFRTALIFSALWLSVSVPARGSDLTVFGGILKPGSLALNNIPADLEGSLVYGLRFQSTFTRIFGLEHSIEFSPNFLKPERSNLSQDVKGFLYSSNLVIRIPLEKATPYFTAGLGTVTPYGSDAAGLFGTKFAVNYGGGVQFPDVLGPLGLRFDARGYSARNVSSASLNFFEFSGGIVLSFGR